MFAYVIFLCDAIKFCPPCFPSIMERRTMHPPRHHTHPLAPRPRRHQPRRREAETRWEFMMMMAHPLREPQNLGSHHRRLRKALLARALCHHSVSKYVANVKEENYARLYYCWFVELYFSLFHVYYFLANLISITFLSICCWLSWCYYIVNYIFNDPFLIIVL